MAAGSETMKSFLRDLPLKISTSRLKCRIQTFEELKNVVSSEDVPEPVLKGLCKIVIHTLHKYQDSKSKSLVVQHMNNLLKFHHDLTIKYFSILFSEFAQNYKNVVITKNLGQSCLTCLTWTCVVIESALRNKDDWKSSNFTSLVQAQFILFDGVLASEDKYLSKKACSRLQYLWKWPQALEMYSSIINQSVEHTSHQIVVFASEFLRFLNKNKNLTLINELKPVLIDLFLKSMVSGKGVKPPNYALNYLKPLLRYVTHNEFKDLMLPSLQKAMLRSPETILPCVAAVIGCLSIDLSMYAKEIGKTLTSQLHSNLDDTRDHAAEACALLAKQCSDAQTICDVVTNMFGVLNGSEGKLTIAAQRMGVINGIGKMSQNSMTGSSSLQEASELVANNFVTILKLEVHEETLVCILRNLSLWCNKLTSKVPQSLMELFKVAFTFKTSTPGVRNWYIMCMNSTFHGNIFPEISEFILLLVKTVEKAVSQSNVPTVVTEGLSASYLLLKVHQLELQTDKQISGIIATILDLQKSPFFTDKFIHQLTDEGLLSLIKVIERILCDHATSIKGSKKSLYAAILYILTRPSQNVRKQAHFFLRRVFGLFDNTELSCELSSEFCHFLQQHKIVYSVLDDDESKENKENANDTAHIVQASLATECLMAICSFLNKSNIELKPELEKLAVESLAAAHHSVIATASPNIWFKMVENMGMSGEDFIHDNDQMILEKIMLFESPILENCIRSIVKACPDVMIVKFTDLAIDMLNKPELSSVTKDEFGIFLTPEGQVYDRSCIESVKEEVNTKNIKRESKLYSYKEQMEDIALRKELQDKRRAKGDKTEPQLSKKQQENLNAQLEKESMTRARLVQLNIELDQAVCILRSCCEGNPLYFSRYLCDVLPVLVSNLKFPLCAAKLSELFVDFQPSVFPKSKKYLGLGIAYTALRLLNPACELDQAWLQEDIHHAVTRNISSIYAETCSKEISNGNFEESFNTESGPKLFTASTFCYCFPFINEVLKLNPGKHEAALSQALEIISQHSQIRKCADPLMDPQLLPLVEMFKALIATLMSDSKKIQVLASKAISDVAICDSGEEQCAYANSTEIILLLDSLLYSSSFVRESSLQALLHMHKMLLPVMSEPSEMIYLLRRLFVSKFDVVEENKELATKLWDLLDLQLSENLGFGLLEDIYHPIETIRQASASALACFCMRYSKSVKETLKSLLVIYHNNLEMPPPVLDDFGRLVSEQPIDPWEPRSGVALAIHKMTESLTVSDVHEVLAFFVPEGLGDRHEEVRREMLNAAVAIIDVHGKDQVSHFLPVFEEFLDKAPKTSSYDTVRQSVIILMGCLAKHLDKADPKVKPIVIKLVDALSTPSQPVQEAVSNCLPPLVPAVRDEAPALVKKLLNLLLESDSYGERKGAAYGLAGLVKGLGILALKQLEIMNVLTTAIQNKKDHKHREGALFAFEMLCNMLGRLFEPYIVHVLPHLLLCFGDGNQYVREATDDTAKAVMSKLSAHGVKLVLPSLLAALEEDSWRTKTGSVELLGAMAYCAPKQLSSCLPNIVPKLIEVLSDSHIKVQKAGAQALKMIGSVIRNPEIQAIVNVLLEALQDPSRKTALCLGTLLNTKFVHFIDAPSLALIMPVVQRAFQDRSTETRKMAAQIIGNMYSLTDQKDLGPYLPTIMPGLQQSLLDPVPEVRCVSARALGAMVKGMGESCFENLMPWLMQTLTSERSSVDRSGAAQGLSEVIGGLGVDKLHKIMPEIISTAERVDIVAHVKDGYMMLFIYMPVVFPKEFTQYIGKIINPILKALADENEYVRDTALRAGQRIVNMYADSAITLLLPQLEAGLFDDNWRIRYSSVQLLGDLLYKISGVSGKMTTETANEDDNFGTEHSQKIILNILGNERRNRVLSGLYMGRSDTALMVRQAALHVWKIIVTNTPRTLREILPTLFSLLLGCLASTSYDKRQVAARTLGDLVRKLGERVLPEIIPILERGLESDQADQRQGVCIGLSEIMASTSKDMVLTFVDSLVPTVRKALCDPLPEVRQAAAKTFDSLHSTVGSRALDETLPHLLEQLGNPELAENTLDGLKNVMAIKSRVVLPYLVPQLTAKPVNTKALSFLSAVAGDSLNKHLPKILPALLYALSVSVDTANETQEREYCERVILSIQDDLGVRTVMDELMEATRDKDNGVRKAAVSLLFAFCCQTKADYTQYISQLIRGLIHLFTDDDPQVLKLSWDALNAVIKTIDSTEYVNYVSNVRQAVRFAVSDIKDGLLPGFCLAKGIAPILPIFREAILNGAPEIKEQAATGLGEVIKLTSAEALQPSVVHITGPLIRILGDRFTWNVKASVLDTLALLLEKVGARLKPFLPQLQTSFLKALNDPNRAVRLKAATAVSHLIVIHNRVDQLFIDLHNTIKTTEDSSIKETMLQALRSIIRPGGNNVSPNLRKQIMQTLLSLISHHEDMTRTCAAGCIGALCLWLPRDELDEIVQDNLLEDDSSADWTLRHGRSVVLFVALKEAPEKILTNEWTDSILKVILNHLTSDRIPIVLSGIRSMGYFVKYMLAVGNCNIPQATWTTFIRLMNHSSNEVKQLLAQMSNYLAKISEKSLPNNLLKLLIPQLVNGTKEKNTVVKANSEYALVSILKLRNGDGMLQAYSSLLDAGARDSLMDVTSKVLKRVASQVEPKDEEVDDTLLI